MGTYSKLHNYTAKKLYETFPALPIRENAHPEWLLSRMGTRLELDIFLPTLCMAAEIQGQQHFEFVPFFHGTIDNFKKRLDTDREKRELCLEAGIKLVEICTETDADIFIKQIRDTHSPILGPEPKYSYSYEYTYYKELILERKLTKRLAAKMRREEIMAQGFPNRKAMKDALQNSEERKLARLSSCKNKLSLFESGQIEASEEKVSAWKRVVAAGGYEEKCL